MPGPIVCAFEDSGSSDHAARAAGWLARELDRELVLCHAFDEGDLPALHPQATRDPMIRAGLEAEHTGRERARARVATAEAAEALPGVRVRTELLEGPPDVVAAFARDERSDLLVVGTVARAGMDRLLQGSVGASLANAAPCPAVVVPQGVEPGQPGPVVAEHDGTDDGLRAVREGAELARALRRGLVVVAEPGVADALALAEELRSTVRGAEAGGDVSVVRCSSDRAATLARTAVQHAACLIVIGGRARGDLRTALFGSFALAVIRTTPCPVVLVPPVG